MMAGNARREPPPAYASMWSRMIGQEVGRILRLGLADGTTCIGRLERVEDGRAIVTVDGRIRAIGLDQLRAIEEVEAR